MDPTKGRRYIEPVKDEVAKGWEHVYNISEDYIHPTAEGEVGWRSASSASSDSDGVLENWQNHMHEVSFRKCGLIMQSLHHVAMEMIALPVYEGLPELSVFLTVFKENNYRMDTVSQTDDSPFWYHRGVPHWEV